MVLSLPERKSAALPIEIRPKQVEAWLARLPLTNNLQAAMQLYQALFSLNRVDLTAQNRLQLMELYRGRVASVASSLHVHFARLVLPLSSKKAQLGEFLRQLHVEMAFGYKLVLQQQAKARGRGKREKDALLLALDRALQYLGQVLLYSYQVYKPSPPGVWKEIHALYEYAEKCDMQEERISAGGEAIENPSPRRRYAQALLLGLCGPYQLPPNECHQVYAFLNVWAGKAKINQRAAEDRMGSFLIDVSSDAPPVPLPREIQLPPGGSWRVLDATGLASTIHGFIERLQRGEPPSGLGLGAECIGSACLDMLRRMAKFWGLSPRRQFSRSKKGGQLSICSGLNAVHFFISGQKSFSPPDPGDTELATQVPEEEIEAGTETEQNRSDAQSKPVESGAPIPFRHSEVFRIEQWQIRDEGAGGFSVSRFGQGGYMRLGDVLGIEDTASGEWHIGVARWLKSPDVQSIEMGVEMLAPRAQPVAIKLKPANAQERTNYRQALLLPAVPALRRPTTLVVPRGSYQSGRDIYLLSDGSDPMLVRPMSLLERSGSFERLVFVPVIRRD